MLVPGMDRRSFLHVTAGGLVINALFASATENSTRAQSADPEGECLNDFGLAAVVHGDLKTVAQSIARDRSLVYRRNDKGESAYLLASYAGQRAVADLLLENGLRLDFHEAVAGGHWKQVEQMLATNPG